VISQFQSNHFTEMILDHIMPLWIQISKTDHSRMKLCGAGGGGYFLVFSRDSERTLALLDGSEYVRVV
jgi:galactokinase/mevalonate kinase-like predicted kinase